MLRSRSNTLVSVRQVTQRNAGRKTAGIDGEVALTPEARAERGGAGAPVPVVVESPCGPARVHSEGIKPCEAAAARNSRDHGPVSSGSGSGTRWSPSGRPGSSPDSYGFRPGRGCQDAIAAIYNVCKGPRARRVWALDADLAAAFDRIDHDHLLAAIGSFPARDLISGWLKAGVFEAGKGFAPTVEGTPQGGVISPCLLNVALHGLEEAAGVSYVTSGTHAGETRSGSPVAIRYADDMVVLCHSQQQAEQVKARLAEWLAPRGLAFNEDKTRIVHLSEGFDFLGFNVRRYQPQAADQAVQGGHQAAPGTARGRDAHPARRQRDGGHRHAQPDHPGLGGLLPGRGVVQVFRALDDYMWKLTYKWATWRHHNKPKHWIVGRYFGKFNKFRNDRWVFGDRDSGAYLVKFSWTAIERHVPVKGAASPDDPALASYWANGGGGSGPRWTNTPCACSPGRTGAARSAGTTC